MDEEQTSAASRRRFVKGAGLAAGMAGAAVLGTSQSAGAIVAPDRADFDVHTLEIASSPIFDLADLGTNSESTGEFGIVGNMVLMTFRIVIGADADFEPHQFCILGSDLPSAYRPAFPFTDLEAFGTIGMASGFGSGLVINYSQWGIGPTSYPVTPAWVNFAEVGVTTPVMCFALAPASVDDNAVNMGGDTPFPLTEGSLLLGSLTYFAAPD